MKHTFKWIALSTVFHNFFDAATDTGTVKGMTKKVFENTKAILSLAIRHFLPQRGKRPG
jgi:hypothetical protein